METTAIQGAAETQTPAAVAEITTNAGIHHTLNYYLQNYTNAEGTRQFGIRVDRLTSENQIDEREETQALSDDRDQVMSLLIKLANGQVTPCTLKEIAEEFI